MKFLHTADWHLGNMFCGHDRMAENCHFVEWLLGQIEEICPDVLLITGDVFDSPNPPASYEELFYDFLARARQFVPDLQVVITSGNSESAARIEAPASLLRLHGVYVRGKVHFTPKGDPDFDHYILPLSAHGTSEARCVCLAIPYLQPGDYPVGLSPEQGMDWWFERLRKRLRKSEYSDLPLVVAAHFHARGAEMPNLGTLENQTGDYYEISPQVLGKDISYVALGHVHKAQKVQGMAHVCYAGSPLPLTFAEVAYKHGIQFAEVDEQGGLTLRSIDYTPLRAFISIPSGHQQAATPAEVFDAIADLPKCKKGADDSDWPYLQIQMAENNYAPDLVHQIMEHLAERAVLFGQIQSVSYNRSETSVLAKELPDGTVTPLQLARLSYRAHFETEMPQTLIDRFKMAEEAVNNIHEA